MLVADEVRIGGERLDRGRSDVLEGEGETLQAGAVESIEEVLQEPLLEDLGPGERRPACVRRPDEHHAAIVGDAQTLDEPPILQPIDHA
jgi:hypothetical protein